MYFYKIICLNSPYVQDDISHSSQFLISHNQSKQMLAGLEEESWRTTAGKGLNSLMFDGGKILGSSQEKLHD